MSGMRWMKNKIGIFLMLSVIILAVTACVPSVETITRQPGNYLYSKNEKIEIVDIETDKVIAILKISDCRVLKNSTFKISEYKNTDSNGSDIYEDVNYEQLIQVNYDFENKPGYHEKISAHNFSVRSDSGEYATINPDIPEISFDENNSFLVALQERSDRLEISFTYDIYQFRDTAKISLNITDVVSDDNNSHIADVSSAYSTHQTSSSISTNKDATSSADKAKVTSSYFSNNQPVSMTHEYLIVVIILLTVAVIALSLALIITVRTKQ